MSADDWGGRHVDAPMPHPDTAPYAAVVRTINGHCAEAGEDR